MVDLLYSTDLSLFYFINHSLHNILLDVVMPWLTDINKHWSGRIILLSLWLLLLLRGGKQGRIAALMLIPSFTLSDQLNSSYLKFIFDRPRPCHVLTDVQLLVPCGSGYSFPSSHAVNNLAAAVVLSHFLPRWSWAFYTFASLMAFSRLYVGVHYPSDVLGGALIGLGCGWLVVAVYQFAERWWNQRKASKDHDAKSSP